MLALRHSPNYSRNLDKAGDASHTCAVCGKAVRNVDRAKWIHLHQGGTSVVTEAEAATLSANADTGMFPVGPECVRGCPELKPYLQ